MKYAKKVCSILIFALISVVSLDANADVTGTVLRQLDREFPEDTYTLKIYFVLGAADMAMSLMELYDGKSDEEILAATKVNHELAACFRKMQGEQIAAILDKHLDKYPEQWHARAGSTLIVAMFVACGMITGEEATQLMGD